MTGIEIIDRRQEEIGRGECKGLRLNIPLSINEKIAHYQAAYKKKFGKKISRENVVLLMLDVSGAYSDTLKILKGEKDSSELFV